MKVRNPMRKSSVCFLHFLHPSLTLDCCIWLEGKSFPNPFNLKYHQTEQRESWICPRSIPTLECFRCSSPKALGTGKVQVARCPCCLWRGGSESVSCLGCFRGLSGRAEVILQCDDVGTLVAIPAHRLLSCSLSLLACFHAMELHSCGWMNAIPYKRHWRPEHLGGRVGLSFKAREARHWSDLQHDPTSGCIQVTDLTHRWCGKRGACPVCWIGSSP